MIINVDLKQDMGQNAYFPNLTFVILKNILIMDKHIVN